VEGGTDFQFAIALKKIRRLYPLADNYLKAAAACVCAFRHKGAA
jgi:hypothetical protein